MDITKDVYMMDFVYRLPLLAFEIGNEKEIQENYPYILKAIRISSPSFYKIIENRSYSQLNKAEKRSLYKYLLRGRYRPVPFGLWTGVGIGDWDHENKIIEGEKVLIGHSNYKFNSSGSSCFEIKYSLAPNAVLVENTIFYWVFDRTSHEWRETGLETNKIILKLFGYLRNQRNIDFTVFFSWFQGVETGLVQDNWKSIIDTDLMVAENKRTTFAHQEISIDQLDEEAFEKIRSDRIIADTHLKGRVSLNRQIEMDLKAINEEMGNLFHPRPSPYLEEFKKHFHTQHDDRFIRLNELLIPYTPLNAHLKSRKWRENPSLHDPEPDYVSHHIGAGRNVKVIDLKTKIKHSPLKLSPETTAVFRLAEGDGLLLDHLSCGKSFCFSGRFSLDREHRAYYQRLRADNYSEKEILFADFELFETPLINQLSTHENLFDYTVKVFGNSETGSEMDLKDLYIGIAGGEVILYYPIKGKRVIPVVQHPVDPVHISHPIGRLLWEIAHQRVHTPKLYGYGPNPAVPYIPRLAWGKLILQPASWLLTFPASSSVEQLADRLRELGVPRFCLMGEEDRALLLDREDFRGMELLFDELNKKKRLILKECVWIGNRSFRNKNREPLYPQFITHLKQQINKTDTLPWLFNPKKEEDPQWISCQVYLSVEDVVHFLTKALPAFLYRIAEHMLKWYYLSYYDTSYQLKIRLQVKDLDFKTGIEKELFFFLSHTPIVQSFRSSPYYPEMAKYGDHSRGLSETLFHMESDINTGRQGGGQPLLKREKSDLYLYITLLGATLLIDNSAEITWPEAYDQHFYQKTTRQERKNMGKFYSQYIRDKPLEEYLRSFIGNYRNLLSAHEYVTDEEKKLIVIENHLHMAVNRLFPENPSEIESYIRFAVYRKIQEHRYRKTDSQMILINIDLN